MRTRTMTWMCDMGLRVTGVLVWCVVVCGWCRGRCVCAVSTQGAACRGAGLFLVETQAVLSSGQGSNWLERRLSVATGGAAPHRPTPGTDNAHQLLLLLLHVQTPIVNSQRFMHERSRPVAALQHRLANPFDSGASRPVRPCFDKGAT